MKFSFIVTATILNLASSQKNPSSININLETAFEFEPNNSRQHLQFIDNVQQFLTKLRSALDTENNNIARTNQGFNICKYIKETLESIAKHKNKNLEDFFQAFRNDTKTRYNTEGFRDIFSDRNTRGHIKNIFADLNKTSTDDKRLMLKYAAMALGKEPESFMQLNEFFSEKDKNTFEKYIDKINDYSNNEKDVVGLVKIFFNFLIYDRYKKLSSNDKAKIAKIITSWSENPKDILLRTGSAKVSDNSLKQKEFVLNNNLEISVNAVPSDLRSNQINLKLVPNINYDDQAMAKDKVENQTKDKVENKTKDKIENTAKDKIKKKAKHKSKNKGHDKKEKRKEETKSQTEKGDANDDSKSSENSDSKNPDKIHENVKKYQNRPKNDDVNEIIQKDLNTLLGLSDKENENTKAKKISTENIQSSYSVSEEIHNNNTSKRKEVNKQPSVEEDSVSQDESQESSRPKRQKQKNIQGKQTRNKNNYQKSDEKSSEYKERKKRTFRNNKRREIKPAIFPVGTFQKSTSETNSNFIVRANSDDDINKIDKDVREANKNGRHDNAISNKEIQKKQDKEISYEDNEMKTKENTEERKNRETFEKAELSFKVLETKFNKIKSRRDSGLEVISPIPKEAYERKRRNLDI